MHPAAPIRSLVTSAAFLALAAAPALAADLVVPSSRYATIQSAADAAATGDRIFIGSGTYREAVFAEGRDNLTFVARGRVIWEAIGPEGEPTTALHVIGSGTVVEGIDFRHGSSHVRLWGHAVTIRRCVSRGARNRALEVQYQGAVGDTPSDDSTIELCTIRGSGSSEAISGAMNRGRISRCTILGPVGVGISTDGTGQTVERCTVDGGGSSVGIEIRGSGGVVTKNRLRRNGGIFASGSDLLVAANQVRNSPGYGVEAQADGIRVEKNLIQSASGGGVYVTGADAAVTANKISDVAVFAGIHVSGSAPQVTGNTVTGVGSGTGIHVTVSGRIPAKDRAAPGDTVIDRNSVTDIGGIGYRVLQFDAQFAVELTNNKALRCGAACTATYDLLVVNAIVRGNQAIDGTGDGFRLWAPLAKIRADGFAIHLEDSVARNCGMDGFWIGPAMNVAMARCQAVGNAGEGLDYRGQGSTVEGCTFRSNRTDFAGGGTFATPPSPSQWRTEAESSEIDCFFTEFVIDI